jgi:hypothetical protein
VHARKRAVATSTFGGTSESAARKQCFATYMSSRSKNTSYQHASALMEMSNSRQRNRAIAKILVVYSAMGAFRYLGLNTMITVSAKDCVFANEKVLTDVFNKK